MKPSEEKKWSVISYLLTPSHRQQHKSTRTHLLAFKFNIVSRTAATFSAHSQSTCQQRLRDATPQPSSKTSVGPILSIFSHQQQQSYVNTYLISSPPFIVSLSYVTSPTQTAHPIPDSLRRKHYNQDQTSQSLCTFAPSHIANKEAICMLTFSLPCPSWWL